MIGQLLSQGLGVFGAGLIVTQGLGIGTEGRTEETHGGFDYRSFKKYRRHLDYLVEVAGEQRKYLKTAAEDAEALMELPVDTSEIEKLTQGPQLDGTLRLFPEIDQEALWREIALIRAYLDMMEAKQFKIAQDRRRDEEFAFLLMIQ